MSTEVERKTEPVSGEMLPSLKLEGLEGALSNLDTLERQLVPIRGNIEAAKVDSKEAAIQMKQWIAELKPIAETAEATVKPYTVIVKRVSDYLKTKVQRVTNAVTETKGLATQKVGEWDRQERIRAENEERQRNEELRKEHVRKAEAERKEKEQKAKEDREKRDREIKEAQKAGDLGKRAADKMRKEAEEREKADKERAAKEAEDKKAAPPVVQVHADVAKVAGVMNRRNYKAECSFYHTFITEFIKRYNAGDHSWDKFVEVSNQKLAAEAREVKDSKKMESMFPGIRAWDDPSY